MLNPEEFTGDSNIASLIADAIGLTGIPALRIETASSAGAAALMAGFQAIASGYYRRVLVLGGEKMTHLTTSAATRILAGVIDKRERQCGATMPALAAMMTEKYRQKSRISESRLEQHALCGVALKNHANGAHNPLAQFQRAIKREAYFASKFVATPLRLYDCAPITDGAAGIVLTSEKTDVCLSGIGQGTGTLSLQDREVFTSFPATKVAAAQRIGWRTYPRKTSISPRCTTLSRPSRSSVPRIWDFSAGEGRRRGSRRQNCARRDAAGQSLRRLESAWSPGRRQRPGTGGRGRQNVTWRNLVETRIQTRPGAKYGRSRHE